jgi:hypothetical protein
MQKVYRVSRWIDISEIAGVMEDAKGKHSELLVSSIQETGQEQRPARMVGLSSLDSAQTSMEAGCTLITTSMVPEVRPKVVAKILSGFDGGGEKYD